MRLLFFSVFVLLGFFVSPGRAIEFNFNFMISDAAVLEKASAVRDHYPLKSQAEVQEFVELEVRPFLNIFRSSEWEITQKKVRDELAGSSFKRQSRIIWYASFLREKLLAATLEHDLPMSDAVVELVLLENLITKQIENIENKDTT